MSGQSHEDANNKHTSNFNNVIITNKLGKKKHLMKEKNKVNSQQEQEQQAAHKQEGEEEEEQNSNQNVNLNPLPGYPDRKLAFLGAYTFLHVSNFHEHRFNSKGCALAVQRQKQLAVPGSFFQCWCQGLPFFTSTASVSLKPPSGPPQGFELGSAQSIFMDGVAAHLLFGPL